MFFIVIISNLNLIFNVIVILPNVFYCCFHMMLDNKSDVRFINTVNNNSLKRAYKLICLAQWRSFFIKRLFETIFSYVERLFTCMYVFAAFVCILVSRYRFLLPLVMPTTLYSIKHCSCSFTDILSPCSVIRRPLSEYTL